MREYIAGLARTRVAHPPYLASEADALAFAATVPADIETAQRMVAEATAAADAKAQAAAEAFAAEDAAMVRARYVGRIRVENGRAFEINPDGPTGAYVRALNGQIHESAVVWARIGGDYSVEEHRDGHVLGGWPGFTSVQSALEFGLLLLARPDQMARALAEHTGPAGYHRTSAAAAFEVGALTLDT